MVMDRATLTQRRQDPAVWDIFITHSVPARTRADRLPVERCTGLVGYAASRSSHGRLQQATQEERIKRWADVQRSRV